ncbi:MAG: hypothetical protein WBA89_27245 [Microcoleus sp.]|uniref:hypothetical protein n=1 Tax=Microcoleus sp. TaxID=44472 RepID=UPI003C777FAA
MAVGSWQMLGKQLLAFISKCLMPNVRKAGNLLLLATANYQLATACCQQLTANLLLVVNIVILSPYRFRLHRNHKIESTVNTQPFSFSTRQQSTVNNQQSAVNSQQSTVNSQQSTINNQQSTANNQQSTVNSQQSTVNNQQSTVNNSGMSATGIDIISLIQCRGNSPLKSPDRSGLDKERHYRAKFCQSFRIATFPGFGI